MAVGKRKDKKNMQGRPLEFKVQRATVTGSILLGIISLLAGLSMYTYMLTMQYIGDAFDLTRSAAALFERLVQYDQISNEVMGRYRAMTQEERNMTGTEEYRRRFEDIERSLAYTITYDLLSQLHGSSDVGDLYLGYYDPDTQALVYICDTDTDEETRFYPGEWEIVERREVERFSNWDGYGMLYDMGSTDKYGFMVTAGTPLVDADEVTVCYVLADITLTEVLSGIKNFLILFGLALMAGVYYIMERLGGRMKKMIVDPVNSIAGAAESFVRDYNSGITGTKHFSELQIDTGDELENLSRVMANMENGLGDYAERLSGAIAEKERIGTELSLARKIQEDVLPGVFPAFPDRTEFDIYASMTPAKEVGGDFYDFFLIDNDHLGLVIADVSGKGVPAALFMMASKILIGTQAMSNKSPAEILETVNNMICVSNKEQMFVTVWIGILEISTGVLKAANAGHEYPVLQQEDGSYALYKDHHGFVIGGMEGMTYNEYEIRMKPYQRLFVYTDGLPEAQGPDSEMFRTDRIVEVLNQNQNADVKGTLRAMQKAVDAFTQGEPLFDDLTMLCLEYFGPEENRPILEKTMPAVSESIPEITEIIEGLMDEEGVGMREKMQIDVALDEVLSNIVRYAYGPEGGNFTVQYAFNPDTRRVSITIIDEGSAFDPLEKEDPDITLNAEERPIGGLGIYLVRRVMDSVTYRRSSGRNILHMEKKIGRNNNDINS